MNKVTATFALTLVANVAFADPKPQDRVYTADQNTNTVSVINPATSTLLGQIRLGNVRPDVLSPLYKGEINVHELGKGLCRAGDERRRSGPTRSHLVLMSLLCTSRKAAEEDRQSQRTGNEAATNFRFADAD